MLNATSSVALVKDKVLPTAIDRVQTLIRPLAERWRPRGASALATAFGKAAPFVRANPVLAVGVALGVGLLLGLVSVGAGIRAKAAEARR